MEIAILCITLLVVFAFVKGIYNLVKGNSLSGFQKISIVAVFAFFAVLMYVPLPETESTDKDVVVSDTNTESEKSQSAFDSERKEIDEKRRNAHLQYIKAKNDGHAGNRSSYLRRVGNTKGDDYRNCINQGYNKTQYSEFDAHDFCAWHAEIGKWQY